MSLNWRQFELGVLRPAQENEAEVAIKLVGETIWHESDRLRALGQYVKNGDSFVFGPGRGICSMERNTWRWLQARPDGQWADNREYEELAWDLRLNVIACRMRYKAYPAPLPLLEDGIQARALYWLKAYNGTNVTERLSNYITNAKAIPWVK